ncbi:MAG: hypothetical protein ACRBCI_13010 [Cellvibrionaceae bacterium]
MARIHITFPLHAHTVERLGLKEDQITELDKVSIFYQPEIGQKQDWRKVGNVMYSAMEQSIINFRPDVIVIGNNRVPESVLHNWKDSMEKSSNISPMIIRRGIELGGIPVELADEYGIHLKNIPRINSPYVARHMLRHLNLSRSLPGQTIAVLGAGDIGLPIIKAAVRNGLHVRIISDSLLSGADNHKRIRKMDSIHNYLAEHGLSDEYVSYPLTYEDALEEAEYVAISVPWWLPKQQRHNIDMLNLKQLKLLAHGATIVSASNPRIFTEEALQWMNQKLPSQRLAKVRIDTGHSYATEVYERYGCKELDVKAGQAFYCEDCLIRLDRALLNVVYEHAGFSSRSLLMAMPRPRDDMDIESYVVNSQHFYNTENVFLNANEKIQQLTKNQTRPTAEIRCIS